MRTTKYIIFKTVNKTTFMHCGTCFIIIYNIILYHVLFITGNVCHRMMLFVDTPPLSDLEVLPALSGNSLKTDRTLIVLPQVVW